MKSAIVVAIAIGLVATTGVAAAAATGPDPSAILDCIRTNVRHIVEGTPTEMCAVRAETAAAAGPGEVVDCARTNVRHIVEGSPTEMCAVNGAESTSEDPVQKAKRIVRCVGDALGGQACHREAEATVGPDPKAVVDCAKGTARAVADALAGHVEPHACRLG